MAEELLCDVCARQRFRDGSTAASAACERQSKRKLAATFRSAMEAFITPEGMVPFWAALQVLQALRSVFYMRGYTAGYKAGQIRALQVSRGTSGRPRKVDQALSPEAGEPQALAG
jgi:hypothetical protein